MSGTLGLVRVMAEAEQLRLRLLLRRAAMRGGLLVAALVFLGAALAMLHVLAVAALEPRAGWLAALAIVTAFDLVMAGVLMLCAARLGPGNAERTALVLRETARVELIGRARMVRMLTAILGLLRRK
jgi:hypothetical protein